MPRRRDKHESQSDILTPFDLAKKLRGAVQAKDLKTLERLFQRSEVDEMDDRSVAFVVRTAVEQHNSSAMALLFNQPTVQSMGPRAIAGLLQTALQYKNVPAVLQLSKLKSAHDINTAYLSYLLEEAMRLGHAEAVQCLSVLQGHQTELEQLVPAGSYAGALRTAVLQGRRQMVYHMVNSDAVQAIEPSIMAGILNTAVQHKSGVMTRFLCWVQAAQLLTAGDVCDVLEGAIRAEDSQAVFYFCEALPGLQDLEAGHITQLLLAAMRRPDITVVCRLCHMPAAHALPAADVAMLLEAALTDAEVCSVEDTVCALCMLLPGCHDLSADLVRRLLCTDACQHSSSVARLLSSLPAVQMPTEELEPDKALPAAVPDPAALTSDDGVATPINRSRSSSPSTDDRLGGASSSCSSSSSSPIMSRSRCSMSSSVGSSFTHTKTCVGKAVTEHLPGSQLLELEVFEELLLPC